MKRYLKKSILLFTALFAFSINICAQTGSDYLLDLLTFGMHSMEQKAYETSTKKVNDRLEYDYDSSLKAHFVYCNEKTSLLNYKDTYGVHRLTLVYYPNKQFIQFGFDFLTSALDGKDKLYNLLRSTKEVTIENCVLAFKNSNKKYHIDLSINRNIKEGYVDAVIKGGMMWSTVIIEGNVRNDFKTFCTYDIKSITIQGYTYTLQDSQTASKCREMIKLMEQKMNKPGFFGIDGTSSNSNRSYSNRTNSSGKATNQGSTTTTFPSQATSQTGVSRSQVKDKFKPWNIDGFNGAKEYEPVGLSVGYVSKQWRIESGGQTTKLGHWQDSKQVQGIQAGLVTEPQFKYGLGLFIGIFYEYYYTKDEPWKKDESSQTDKPASNISGENHPVQRTRGSNYKGRDHLKYTQSEHALYIPVRLEYRANFSKDFQLFAYGGLAADIGLGGNYEIYNETSDFETISMSGSDIYDNPNLCHGWKSFNLSYEFGGGLRVARHIQLGFTMSKGLLNMSESDNYKVYQDKNLMLTLAVMF